MGRRMRTLSRWLYKATGGRLLFMAANKTYMKPQRPADYARMVEDYRELVYACATFNAVTVASIPLRLYRRGKSRTVPTRAVNAKTRDWLETIPSLRKYLGGPEDIEEILDHPLLQLLHQPNPQRGGFSVLEDVQLSQELTGNGYWYMPSSRMGLPTALWWLQSHRMTIIPDPVKFVDHYEYMPEGAFEPVRFTPEEIVHFRFPNPTSMLYGMGPLEAAARSVKLDFYMTDYENNLLENGARPDMLFTTPADVSLGEDQWDRFLVEMQDRAGGVGNAGTPIALEGDVRAQQLSLTPREMSYLNSRKVTREKIANDFGIPIPMLTPEDVNKANAVAAEYVYRKYTIFPRCMRSQDTLNRKLSARYGTDVFLAYDNIVPEDEELSIQRRESNLKFGVTTRDEERRAMRMPPLESPDDGSVALIPVNMQFADQARQAGAARLETEEEPTPPTPPVPSGEDEAGSEEEERIVLGDGTYVEDAEVAKQMAEALQEGLPGDSDLLVLTRSLAVKGRIAEIGEPVQLVVNRHAVRVVRVPDGQTFLEVDPEERKRVFRWALRNKKRVHTVVLCGAKTYYKLGYGQVLLANMKEMPVEAMVRVWA